MQCAHVRYTWDSLVAVMRLKAPHFLIHSVWCRDRFMYASRMRQSREMNAQQRRRSGDNLPFLQRTSPHWPAALDAGVTTPSPYPNAETSGIVCHVEVVNRPFGRRVAFGFVFGFCRVLLHHSQTSIRDVHILPLGG